VPAGQQLLLAERARAAGNRVGALVFDGAAHGVGGVNSAAGRAAVLRFLCEHLGRGPAAPPPPRPQLLSRAASGLGLLLGTEPVAAAVAAVAWSPDAAGLASGGGAGAQHVRRCEGVLDLHKLPSWAQYEAKVLRKYVYSRRPLAASFQGTGRGARRPAAVYSVTDRPALLAPRYWTWWATAGCSARRRPCCRGRAVARWCG
jgi:hypothetical protein